MENKDKDLIEKLREASKKNYFTLSLSLNGTVIEQIDFSAEKYDKETFLQTRTYFLMSDLKKKVLEVYSEKEREIRKGKKRRRWINCGTTSKTKNNFF